MFGQKNWFAFDNRMEIENDIEAQNGKEHAFLALIRRNLSIYKRQLPDTFIAVSICAYMYIYTRISLTTFIHAKVNIIRR